MTYIVNMKDESRGRPIQKTKIKILLGKTENFDELMGAAAEEKWRKMATTAVMEVIGGGLWQAQPN